MIPISKFRPLRERECVCLCVFSSSPTKIWARRRARMAAEEEKSPNNPQNPPRRSPRARMKESILSPGFRSAAAMAGWDEEALLFASLVVEDTPVRESRHRKRRSPQFKTPPTTNSNRKRRSRRQSPNPIPPVVLCLDDDEEKTVEKKDPGAKRKDSEIVVAAEEKKTEGEGASAEKASCKGLPCMDRLREELSCAICLDICFEPSTTPCGHSFCMKCLKCAAAKCGKRCPKCRQLISNGRSCTVNTVLWNTIQLLFPEEVEARKNSSAATSRSSNVQSPERSSNNVRNSHANSNTRSSHTRSATQVSQGMDRERIIRRRAIPSQSEDAALALRLQREEFMVAFHDNREQQSSTLHSAQANLRAMASRAVHFRTRGRST